MRCRCLDRHLSGFGGIRSGCGDLQLRPTEQAGLPIADSVLVGALAEVGDIDRHGVVGIDLRPARSRFFGEEEDRHPVALLGLVRRKDQRHHIAAPGS